MIGSGRRALLVGGEGVVLYSFSSRRIERETAIAWEVPNFERHLADVLEARNQSSPVVLLFDGADQTYRKEENIPKLSPFDRPRFVKRKLELAFPSYPIRAALEVKQPKVKGRETPPSSYLFVALPEIEQLDRISVSLLDSGVPVGGFGLLPAESSGLVTELSTRLFSASGQKSRWAVLIGQHETGGLRQVVVKDGNLALTRLTPPSEAGTHGAAWAEETQREIRATLTYISRFGYSSEDGLDIVVVCGELEKQFFDAASMPVTNFRTLTPAEALRKIGFTGVGLEKSNFADALHAAWAAKRSRLRMPIVVPSIARVQKPRQAVRAASIFLGVSAVGLGFLVATAQGDYVSYESDIALKQNQKIMLQREYEQESKIFDGLPIKPDVVKAAIGVSDKLAETSGPIAPFLRKLRGAVGDDVRFVKLDVVHEPSDALPIGEAKGPNVMAMVQNEQPSPKGKLKVNFHIRLPDAMSLEDKVKRAETLLEKLKADFPDYKVRIESQFGKVTRAGSFEGKVGNVDGGVVNNGDVAELSMEGAPL